MPLSDKGGKQPAVKAPQVATPKIGGQKDKEWWRKPATPAPAPTPAHAPGPAAAAPVASVGSKIKPPQAAKPWAALAPRAAALGALPLTSRPWVQPSPLWQQSPTVQEVGKVWQGVKSAWDEPADIISPGWKNMPVVGDVLEQAVRTGHAAVKLGGAALRGLTIPALATEEALGRGVIQHQSPDVPEYAEHRVWQEMDPEGYRQAMESVRERRDAWLRPPPTETIRVPGGREYARGEILPEDLAQKLELDRIYVQVPRDEQGNRISLRRYAMVRDPRLAESVLAEVSAMTYSRYEKQVRAIDRMMNGEDPETVRSGNVDVRDALRVAAMSAGIMAERRGRYTLNEESLAVTEAAIMANDAASRYYTYQVEQLTAQGVNEYEARRTTAEELLNKGVPGEKDPVHEFVGQLLLDPLNLLDVAGVTGAAVREQRFARRAVRDLALLDDTPLDEVLAAAAKRPEGLRKLFDHTPGAYQNQITEEATNRLAMVLSSVNNNTDRTRLIKAILDLGGNQDEVADAMRVLTEAGLGRTVVTPQMARDFRLPEGAILSPMESAAGKRLTVFLRRALTNADGVYEPKYLLNAVRNSKSVDDAVSKLVTRVASVADELHPIPEAHAIVRANNNVRGFVAKWFHLGTNLGYAVRNALTNFVQGVIDGVVPLTRIDDINAFYKRVGYAPAAVSRGLGGGPAREAVKIADNATELVSQETGKKIGALRRWWRQGGFVGNSATIEDAFGTRAVYTGMINTFNRYWRPGRAMSDEAVTALKTAVGDDMAMGLVTDAMTKLNPGELDELYDALLKGSGYTELWRNIPAEYVDELQELGMLEAVTRITRSAPDAESFTAGIDDLIKVLYQQADEAASTIPKGSVYEEIAEQLFGRCRRAVWSTASAGSRRSRVTRATSGWVKWDAA